MPVGMSMRAATRYGGSGKSGEGFSHPGAQKGSKKVSYAGAMHKGAKSTGGKSRKKGTGY